MNDFDGNIFDEGDTHDYIIYEGREGKVIVITDMYNASTAG